MRRLAVAAFLGGVGFLAARPALAEDADVDHLMQNLSSGSDFRIRTQAALALGASKSKRAIEPLCGALADPNATVRAASAAALGRLHLGGSECLQKRLANEASDTVKAAIQKALDPVFTSDTKYYLAIGKTTDKTGRSGDEIDGIVHSAMSGAASLLPVFAVAPSGETLLDAKRRLAPHRGVKSYFLSPRIGPPDYSGGNLTVKLEIAMFSYPDKALVGNYSTKLTEPGVSSPDQDSENDLIKTAGERALDKFTQIAAHLQ
ncbi:MAG: HEAT repeat domain-containing protein [Polyangiaceae bacterium]